MLSRISLRLLLLITLLTTGTGSGAGARARRTDRGDVPGWVLITMMTAALVVALWALAGEAFTSMFEDSMNKVSRAG
ncbi:hypothetical protein GCM10022261_03690 [Brevibacterium daeguense]|uniref:Uncharacterized protein n=1 Tax=Brevibacterium daeguense TaxID=909936 RepID=A0ABP8EFT3_9MICO|nr:hypothetical protein [Brevibacterium daeguense]